MHARPTVAVLLASPIPVLTLPDLSLIPVSDSAHFAMLDQPVAFATALNAALKSPSD